MAGSGVPLCSCEELRERSPRRAVDLAAFEAAKGCAISLYLDLDPSVSPTAGDAATRTRCSTRRPRATANRRDLTHDQRQGLKADFAASDYYEREFTRRGPRAGDLHCRRQRLAAACPHGVGARRREGRRALYLAPLVPLVGGARARSSSSSAASAGSSTLLRGGRLEELADHTEEQPGSTTRAAGRSLGFSATSRRSCTTISRRSRKSSTALSGACTVHRSSSSPRRRRADFDHLQGRPQPPSWAGRRPRRTRRLPSSSGGDAGARALACRAGAGGDRALARGSGPKRTSCGLGADARGRLGRVDLLLFQDGVDHPPPGARAADASLLEDGKCPLDGTSMERSTRGLDLAVHQTLAHGGTVGRSRQDLEPVEGIGALLRY